MRIRLFASAVALALFAVVPAALSARATVGASGQIAGSGTTYTLTLTNTGDEPILCFKLFFRPPVTAAGVQGPAGWSVQTLGSGLAIGGQSATGIAPSTSAAFAFTTTQPLATTVGTEPVIFLVVSATCQPNSDVNGQVNQVPVQPPPPPPAEPCKCTSLTAEIVSHGILVRDVKLPNGSDGMKLTFLLRWTTDCTAGAGGCQGQIRVKAPTGKQGIGFETWFNPGHTFTENLVCTADCAESQPGDADVVLYGSKGLTRRYRGSATGVRFLPILVTLTCSGHTRTEPLRLVFDPETGKVDATKGRLK